MLRPNNPDIDFDQLNRRIQQTLDAYQDDDLDVPEFDPAAALMDVAEESDLPVDPATLPPLIAYNDCEFVEHAYRQILGREVDPEGLEHYVAQLRLGEDKVRLLQRLCNSEEGQSYLRNAPFAPNLGVDLDKQASKDKLFGLPVVGPILKLLSALAGFPRYKQVLNARFTQLFRLVQEQSDRLQRQSDQIQMLEARLHDTQQKQIRTERKHHTLLGRLRVDLDAQLQREQSRDKEVQQSRIRLTSLESQASAVAAVSAAPAAGGAGNLDKVDSASINEAFYAAFEEHFRGSSEVIEQRLQYYLPILAQCAPLSSGGRLVDIGCGRGEWLDVVAAQGYAGLGIDLNALNVEACESKGHDALATDGIEWLAQQEDDSLAAISCFHVIEHLPFPLLNRFLDQAMRVLQPGGLLIAETPNPENLVTGITHFYTDPTHLNPLPPALSEFLLQYKGFDKVAVHRLNPIPAEYALVENTEVDRRCNQLFYGPQDYAVVGSKPQ